jgi:acetyl esterase/lipase
MPEPLRDWLAGLNETRKALSARGFRHTATNAREALHPITRRFVTQVPEIPWIRDDLIPGPDYLVPLRIYHPEPAGTLPVAVFLHGGGHVSGSVSLYDPIARKIALATGRIVASVEYRLAPECPYPAAVKDALAAVKGVYRLLDAMGIRYQPRLALIGDSGGGALCATLAHRCQFEPDVAIERQALIYPSLDYSLSFPSVTANGTGYLLERDRILWLFDCYLQNAEDRRAVSPLYMPITPDYPETLIVTAEYCPLRDEGIAYARRLSSEGVACEHQDFAGVTHAFLNLEDLVPGHCGELYRGLEQFFRD